MGKKKMGRPEKPPEKKKTRYLQVRLEQAEKDTFDAAADLAGVPLSVWIRERLRTVARKELRQEGQDVPLNKKSRS